MQLLFEGSEENGGCEGLGLIPGMVTHFDTSLGLPVPHIGWNDLHQRQAVAFCCALWKICKLVGFEVKDHNKGREV